MKTNIISDAKLFVGTLENDKYLYEDAILSGVRTKTVFWGIPQNVDKYLLNRLCKVGFIAVYPFALIVLVGKNFIQKSICNLCHRKRILFEDEYFLASTNFSKSINNRINKHIKKSCWLLNDGVNPNDYVIPSGKYIYSQQLINIPDIFSASIGTFIAYILICKQYGFFYMLCSMNAFKWLMYWKACKKIPVESSLYFINHKDRWAFLEDHINSKNKTLIQHGTETDNCSDIIAKKRALHPIAGGGWTQNMPYKYQTLSRVIAFSEREISAMKLSVIRCEPEFVVSGYSFETYPLKSDNFSVLIIAYSEYYFDIEFQILKALQDFPIDIYIKNHPTQSNVRYESIRKKMRFTLLKEQCFPQVNCVIAYNSTLAHEYSSVGVEVIYHTIYSIDEIKRIIKNIYEKNM